MFTRTRLPIQIWICFCLLIDLGCNTSSKNEENSSVDDERWSNQVTIVSYPMYAALQSVCDSRLELFYPEVPDGKAMDRETVRRIQSSRLIVLDGTHHVGWVDTVALPENRKRLSTFDILDQLIMVDNLGSHSHGPGGEHSHSGIVSQTWLDPSLFKLQLQAVSQAFLRAQLLESSEVDLMLDRWWASIRPLEDKLALLSQQPVRRVIADRAGSEYLFRRLGWPVEIQELDKLATKDPGQLLGELRELLAEHVKLIIVLTKSPEPQLAEILQQSGIPIIQLDLLESPTDQDFLFRMHTNLENLEKLLSQSP